MKTALFVSLGLASVASALEVHEWGTFTILSDSDGHQIPWYQPASDLAALPDFVEKRFSKTGLAKVRMETPVLYFYPEEAQNVSVSVNFLMGNITEAYPFTTRLPEGILATTSWSGKLLPPNDAEVLALIPPVTEIHPEEPYAAAREVPDAWIFRSDQRLKDSETDEAAKPQAEKFIFYRGSGNFAPPVSLSFVEDNAIILQNKEALDLSFSVALKVTGNLAAWEIIAPTSKEKIEISFSKSPMPIHESETELSLAFETALEKQGLTSDEAAAMVAT